MRKEGQGGRDKPKHTGSKGMTWREEGKKGRKAGKKEGRKGMKE